jgi:hypothetical protein
MLDAARGVTVPKAAGARREAHGGRGVLDPRRRDLLARLSVMSLAGPGASRSSDPGTGAEATAVARAWLDLVHSGRSASSWAVAAPVLRETIPPDDWEAALRSVRVALGRCRTRRLRAQSNLDGFPGVPSGPYTVVHFESGFEKRQGVTETVTTCLGPDGHWRVAAYFVR